MGHWILQLIAKKNQHFQLCAWTVLAQRKGCLQYPLTLLCFHLSKALLWQVGLQGQICSLKPIKYPCKEGRVRVAPSQLSTVGGGCEHPMRARILPDLAELVWSRLLHAMVSLAPTARYLPLVLSRAACSAVGNAEQRCAETFGNFVPFNSRRIKPCTQQTHCEFRWWRVLQLCVLILG